MLCARQLVQEISQQWRPFWKAHKAEAREQQDSLKAIKRVRKRLVEEDKVAMPEFLAWFEPWFLKKARPIEEEVRS